MNAYEQWQAQMQQRKDGIDYRQEAATEDNRQQLYEIAGWLGDDDMRAALRARWRPLEFAERIDGKLTVWDWRDGTHWQWLGEEQTIEQLNALLEVQPGACVSIGWLAHFVSADNWQRLD